MSQFAKGLMNVQEMVKGLLGLEKEQPLSWKLWLKCLGLPSS
jgi:hypothetical protein